MNIKADPENKNHVSYLLTIDTVGLTIVMY